MNPFTFCTYFNITYLTRGLAMYRSLVKNCKEPFVLWILCFDDETYQVLAKLNLAHVKLISMDEFEEFESELKVARGNRSAVEFFWTCTPILPLYVFAQDSAAESVTYVDADLWFIHDPVVLLEELKDSSVLIVGHRYSERYIGREAESGIYNVSWVSFKRDDNALECLAWWRERCLNNCQLGGEGATCGDQKYLDEWPKLFKGIKELVHKGVGLAPWNLGRYDVSINNGLLIVDDEPLVFYHFHGYKQIGKLFAKPMDLHYCEDCNAVVFRRLYFAYGEELLRFYREVRRVGYRLELKEIDLSLGEIINGLMLHAYFLNGLGWLSELLWKFGGWRYRRMIDSHKDAQTTQKEKIINMDKRD